MPTNALIGAIVGAVLGAVVWAAISHFTGYEVGYVAWGIGALVGGLAARLGSKGTTAGMTCAGLALVSIFAGKVIATDLAMKKELSKFADQIFTIETHAELAEDAAAFDKLTSEADWPQFLIDRGYSAAESPAEVDAEEIATFKRETLPEIQPFRGGRAPDFQSWSSERREAFLAEATAGLSTTEIVTDSLGLMDIIFALLGVVTAFKLGEGLGDSTRGGGERPQRPHAGAPPRPGDGPPGPGPDGSSGPGQAPTPHRRR